MKIDEAVRNRRTVRQYVPKKVPKKSIMKILDAARWAPSAHNSQPWRFIVAEGEAKKNLADIVGHRKRKDVLPVKILLGQSAEMISSASAAIIVYNTVPVHRVTVPLYVKEKKMARVFCIQSTAASIQNMLLTAHSLGFGTAWLGVPLFRQEEIKTAFDIAGELMAVITIGYPKAHEGKGVSFRRPITEIISFKE
ncbi:MAG: nitroreductase family protein [Candidatus Omnitrophota bacterium]